MAAPLSCFHKDVLLCPFDSVRKGFDAVTINNYLLLSDILLLSTFQYNRKGILFYCKCNEVKKLGQLKSELFTSQGTHIQIYPSIERTFMSKVVYC